MPSVRETFKLLGVGSVCIFVVFLIHNHDPENFSQVEAVWTIMGLVGFISATANLYDAINDLHALEQAHGEIAKKRNLLIIAHASIRVESLRVLKMLVVITMGVISGIQPPILTDAERAKYDIPIWTPANKLLTVGFFIIVTIIVIQILLDRRLRKTFYSRQVAPRSSDEKRQVVT